MNFYEKKEELGDILYEKVGIVRRESELESALEFIELLKEQLPKMGVKDKSKLYNTNLIEFLEFKNILEVSSAVVEGALARKVSCGAHYIV